MHKAERTSGAALTPAMELKPWLDGAGGLACFSPDGQRLATATLTAVQVWNANSGQAITLPVPVGGYIEHMAFSHDGKRLATASFDGTARL